MRSALLLLVVVPSAALALDCVFQTDPLHTIGAKIEGTLKGDDAKSYTCAPSDRYCIFFEGDLEVAGKNQTFTVRSCESDVLHYLGPIGDKIGQKLEAKCSKTGEIRKKIGPLYTYFNCCTDSDCNKNSALAVLMNKFVLLGLSAVLLIAPTLM